MTININTPELKEMVRKVFNIPADVEFDVSVTDPGSQEYQIILPVSEKAKTGQKTPLIKAVRGIVGNGLGLAEAKAIVEDLTKPYIITSFPSLGEAEAYLREKKKEGHDTSVLRLRGGRGNA